MLKNNWRGEGEEERASEKGKKGQSEGKNEKKKKLKQGSTRFATEGKNFIPISFYINV